MKRVIEVRLVKRGFPMGKTVNTFAYESEGDERQEKEKEAIACCKHWYENAFPAHQRQHDFLVVENGEVIYKANPD